MPGRLWEASAGRAFVGRLDAGDDLVEEIEHLCADHDVRAAWVSVIGAVRQAAFAYYDQEDHRYLELESDEHHEITGFVGNISMRDGRALPACPRHLLRAETARPWAGTCCPAARSLPRR